MPFCSSRRICSVVSFERSSMLFSVSRVPFFRSNVLAFSFAYCFRRSSWIFDFKWVNRFSCSVHNCDNCVWRSKSFPSSDGSLFRIESILSANWFIIPLAFSSTWKVSSILTSSSSLIELSAVASTFVSTTLSRSDSILFLALWDSARLPTAKLNTCDIWEATLTSLCDGSLCLVKVLTRDHGRDIINLSSRSPLAWAALFENLDLSTCNSSRAFFHFQTENVLLYRLKTSTEFITTYDTRFCWAFPSRIFLRPQVAQLGISRELLQGHFAP